MLEWIFNLFQVIAPSLIVGIVLAFWNNQQSKKEKKHNEKEKDMKKKDSLEIALLVATAELSYATTMAIKRGSPNGEVEIAVKRYNKAMEKFREFEREQLYYID
ncbi:MAG: hypothetical protein J6V23_07100 [Bacteroidaceae bacterium]|nr:hypothetical protein [Bacteroidaceae bacterium]